MSKGRKAKKIAFSPNRMMFATEGDDRLQLWNEIKVNT